MRVQHNIMAMNAYRNYTANTSALSKNLEKLSSGYKINRAGDDAAGLAISEKMRAQITGLETAQKNAKDGISLVQTAEGALTEVHDMLNRMVELADQSANGTYDNENDRAQLQKEVDALRSEINRIADSSNFNGIKLLDGSLAGGGNVSGSITLSDVAATKGVFTSGNFGNAGGDLTAGSTIDYTVAWKDASGQDFSTTIKLTVNAGVDKLVAEDGTEYAIATTATKGELQDAIIGELKKNNSLASSFDIAESTDAISFTSKTAGANGATITALGMTSTDAKITDKNAGTIASSVAGADAMQKVDVSKLKIVDPSSGKVSADDIEKGTFEIDGKKFLLAKASANGDGENLENVPDDVTVIYTKATTYAAGDDAANIASELKRVTGMDFSVNGSNEILYKGEEALGAGSGGMTLQIGDSSDDYNQLNFTVKDVHAAALGIDAVDISTQAGAKAADTVLKAAINTISDIRGGLGAIQNRLDHTINNLGVMTENIQDAESNIRDTDVAEEMMSYTKNNILVQSAQAMLAQANQVPQGVLQLLQ